ncbi:kinase-like domain, phloem protein 2-like protein [Tanacetum coccineum]
MLSPDTEYVCKLLFKLSENCRGMHYPVKVRDVLHQENKEAKFLYFITPEPSNIHDITRVPKQREDGWMEIQLWKFNSAHEFKDDSLSMNMKFTSHQGTMSGLIVCGLEFQPFFSSSTKKAIVLCPEKFTEEACIFSGCRVNGDGNPAGIDHLDELSSIVMIAPSYGKS